MLTARTQYRIDPTLKISAEKILKKLGIKPSQALTMFYTEITRTRTLPFTPTKVLKEELINEIQDIEQGVGVKTYKNKTDLFKSLNKS